MSQYTVCHKHPFDPKWHCQSSFKNLLAANNQVTTFKSYDVLNIAKIYTTNNLKPKDLQAFIERDLKSNIYLTILE
jgi:hypothetical protein